MERSNMDSDLFMSSIVSSNLSCSYSIPIFLTTSIPHQPQEKAEIRLMRYIFNTSVRYIADFFLEEAG